MKTIMLIMTLIGFALSGYAQRIVYRCPYQHIHTTKVTHKKKVAAVPKKAKVSPVKAYTWSSLVSCGANSVSCTNLEIGTSRSFSGYASPSDLEYTLLPLYGDLDITSTAFVSYDRMPAKYTCQGQRVSPPLTVGNIPQGTRSLAIIMDDPHATPAKGTTFWVMWNVDTDLAGNIPENFLNNSSTFNKESQQYGYQAVCPLDGARHEYHFRVYALDTKLTLDRRTTDKLALQRVMQGHVLAKGEIVGTYMMD